MIIKFPISMVFDVFYTDRRTKEPVTVQNTFEGEYDVESLELEEPRFGYSAFMIHGNQKDALHNDLFHGGIFEVPNPAFDIVAETGHTIA